jgi:hypothetical protein
MISKVQSRSFLPTQQNHLDEKSSFQVDYSFNGKLFSNQLHDSKTKGNTLFSGYHLTEPYSYQKRRVQTDTSSSNSPKQQTALQLNSRELQQSLKVFVPPFEPFQIGTLKLHCYCFDVILESLYLLIIKICTVQDKSISFFLSIF